MVDSFQEEKQVTMEELDE